jgi:hypothetical protein
MDTTQDAPQIGEAGGRYDLVRRVEDLSSGQYLDMSADAPSFDVPEGMDPQSQLCFLDVALQRLYFPLGDDTLDFVQDPELRRVSQRRHDERCLVTTGQSDEQGRRIYWLCRIER